MFPLEALLQKEKRNELSDLNTQAVDQSVNYGLDDDCPVCLSPLVDPRRLPHCGHHLCLACLNQLRKYSAYQQVSCPECRGPLPRGAEKDWEEALGKRVVLARKMEARGLSLGEGGAVPADLKAEAMRNVASVVEAQKIVAEMEALWDPKKLGEDSDDD